MSNFEVFYCTVLLTLACFGSCYIGVKVIKDRFVKIFSKSKKRRKKPSEIEREVDEILREHIG